MTDSEDKATPESKDVPPALARAREEIEQIDRQIVELIARRVDIALKVGELKREAGLPTLDHAREAAVIRRAVSWARKAGIEFEDEIRQIFWQLIGLSRRSQKSDD